MVLFALCVCSNLNLLPSAPSTEADETFVSTTTPSSQTATQSDKTTSSISSPTTKPEASHSEEILSEHETTQTVAHTQKPEQTTIKKDDSVITVSVYCSCKNAIDYGIRAKKSYLPESGIMLNTTVTVKKGSTALAAIKEACNKSGIKIDEKRGYIRGINDLYEKDCGGASGWMYSVNGSFPNVSSDKYTLSSGERIELHYTVKLGDVS